MLDRLFYPGLPGIQILQHLVQFRNGDVLRFQILQYDLNLGFRLQVDFKIDVGLDTVMIGLAVLAHHDHGGGICRLKRQHKVHQDEGVGIPVLNPGGYIQDCPQGKDERLADDKLPGTNLCGDPVGGFLADRQLLLDDLVDVLDRAVLVPVGGGNAGCFMVGSLYRGRCYGFPVLANTVPFLILCP